MRDPQHSYEESITPLRQRLNSNKQIMMIHPPSISPTSSSSSFNSFNNDKKDTHVKMDSDAKERDKSFARQWALTLYSITTILLFADQNLLAPNLSAAATEFGFNDLEKDALLGGQIALAFFLIGAPASFLVGCYADSKHVSRNVLFGTIVLIGESACLATYWTTTYRGLFLTRALTGFSVGGALPLLSSVLGDWYPPRDRAKVMANLGIGTGMGIAVGQAISGWIGPVYGWRMPFLVVSVPALIVAVVIITTVVDPQRGESDLLVRSSSTRRSSSSRRESPVAVIAPLVCASTSSSQEEDTRYHRHIVEEESFPENDKETFSASPIASTEPRSSMTHSCQEPSSLQQRIASSTKTLLTPSTYIPHLRTTQKLCSTPSVLLTLFQGAPGCIPWGIVNTFLNDYLSTDCGLTVQAATTVILVFGLGNFVGVLVGGWGGSALYAKDIRYPNVLAGTMAIFGCFPLWILINTTQAQAQAQAVSQYGYGDDDGVDVDASTTSTMSLGQAIFVFFIAFLAGVGSGVTGPIVKATLQNVTLPQERGQAFALLNTFDDFGRGLGPVFVAAMIQGLGGRVPAFNVGVGGWVLCGVLNLVLFWTIEKDEETRERLFRLQYGDGGGNGGMDDSPVVEESNGIV